MKLFFLITLFFTLTLISCEGEKDEVIKNNIIRLPITTELTTLDPAKSYDTVSAIVVYQGYETLYEYHYLKRPYELRPLLAEEMPTIDQNGTRYTIKIKKHIRYHNDPSLKQPRYVKAEDFITQIKRLAFIPTRSNGWWFFDNKIKGLNKFREIVGTDFSKLETTNIEGVTAPDEHTLVIKLNKPAPQLLYSMAMTFTSPVPIESVKYYKNNLHNKIIGTGPFYLETWKKNSYVKMKRFKDYHECFYPRAGEGDRYAYTHGLMKDNGHHLPFLDGIKFIITKESLERWNKFEKDDIDVVIIPKDNYENTFTQAGELKDEIKSKKIGMQISPTMTSWWLSFNMKKSPLGTNKYLRLAIAHAIDFDEYIRVFTNNIGQKANSIYHPGIPGYDPSHRLPYKYDITLAKDYLVKAGYPNGKGLPVIKFDTRGTTTVNIQQAKMIKKNLEKIGVKLKIVVNTFPEFLKKSRTGEVVFWQGGWTLDYPDAENILQLLITDNHAPGPNSSLYSNKEFDEYYKKFINGHDEIEKRSLMVKMEKITNRDLPWIMQYYVRNYVLHKNRLKNFRYSDIIYNSIKYYKLK